MQIKRKASHKQTAITDRKQAVKLLVNLQCSNKNLNPKAAIAASDYASRLVGWGHSAAYAMQKSIDYACIIHRQIARHQLTSAQKQRRQQVRLALVSPQGSKA